MCNEYGIYETPLFDWNYGGRGWPFPRYFNFLRCTCIYAWTLYGVPFLLAIMFLFWWGEREDLFSFCFIRDNENTLKHFQLFIILPLLTLMLILQQLIFLYSLIQGHQNNNSGVCSLPTYFTSFASYWHNKLGVHLVFFFNSNTFLLQEL